MSGKELKKFLSVNEISQEEAAQIIGVTRQTINLWCQKTKLSDKILQKANVLFLKYKLENSEITSNNNSGVIISGNNTTGDIDNRQYYSDSPDVLRMQIQILEERIQEKESQLQEKESQLQEKESQINNLLEIVKNLSVTK